MIKRFIVFPVVVIVIILAGAAYWWYGATIPYFGTPSVSEMSAGTYDVKINGSDDNQRFYSPTSYDLTWTISPEINCVLFGYFGEERGFISREVDSSGSEKIEKLNSSGTYLYSLECREGNFTTGDLIQVYVD